MCLLAIVPPTAKFLFIFTAFFQFNFCLSLLISKNGKVQKRGKVNLIGRLQLSTEKTKQEENDGIVALRILRIQVRYYIFYLTSCSLSLHSFTIFVSSEL